MRPEFIFNSSGATQDGIVEPMEPVLSTRCFTAVEYLAVEGGSLR